MIIKNYFEIMSVLHRYKDQVRKTNYPLGKLLLVLVGIKKYHAYNSPVIPERIYDLNRPFNSDNYGNGRGIDHHGNKGK